MKRFQMMARRPLLTRGFTLIELMIVVAVVAILAAIAYPSYMDSIRKGWRAEARTALMQEMQQQERFYTQVGKYRGGSPFKSYSGDSAVGSKYTLAVAACEGDNDLTKTSCIRLTATLLSGSDPQAGVIWLESTGLKGCDGSMPERCWK